jgi:hypothetical protein
VGKPFETFPSPDHSDNLLLDIKPAKHDVRALLRVGIHNRDPEWRSFRSSQDAFHKTWEIWNLTSEGWGTSNELADRTELLIDRARQLQRLVWPLNATQHGSKNVTPMMPDGRKPQMCPVAAAPENDPLRPERLPQRIQIVRVLDHVVGGEIDTATSPETGTSARGFFEASQQGRKITRRDEWEFQ